MNIFVTNTDPRLAPLDLDDLRLNKMIIETAQLLSTALEFRPEWAPEFAAIRYKSTHVNHPCNVWTRLCLSNFSWLCRYFVEAGGEYYLRRDKLHATHKLFAYKIPRSLLFETIPEPETFQDSSLCQGQPGSVVEHYRRTMRIKWTLDIREPTWVRRGPPIWL